MVDKRIKISEKEIYDFTKKKQMGVTWTELKNEFVDRVDRVDRITEQQLANKLKRMIHVKKTLMHVRKYYLPYYHNFPKQIEIESAYHEKIEDPYIPQGFNKYYLEQMDEIIHDSLFIRLQYLFDKYHEILEVMKSKPECDKCIYNQNIHQKCDDCYSFSMFLSIDYKKYIDSLDEKFLEWDENKPLLGFNEGSKEDPLTLDYADVDDENDYEKVNEFFHDMNELNILNYYFKEGNNFLKIKIKKV